MTRKEYCVAIAKGDIAKVKKMSKRHLLKSAKRKKIPTLGCFSIDTRDNCRCWKSNRLPPRGRSRSATDRIAFPENKSLLAMVCAKKCHCIMNGEQAQQKKVVTPLHIACYYGKVEVVRYLLKKDVTALNVNQFLSPLMIASLCQKEENALNIVTMLVEAGADLNATDDLFHYTALHLAVIKNRPKLVKLMLRLGCKVNPKQCRLSPLFVAARNKCSEILLGHGATVLKILELYCPLQDAIDHDDVEAVRRYVSTPRFRPDHRYRTLEPYTILHTVVECHKEIPLPYVQIILFVGRNPGFGGDTIELTCSADSYSLPISGQTKMYYFWKSSLYGNLRNISSGPAQIQNGDVVPGYNIKNDGKTLMIVSAQYTDDFLCSAQEEGSPYKYTSVNFTLTVYGKPRTYDFYPPSRISNAALSGSAAMYFSYQTTTPLTSYTNWSFVNASGSTAEYPRDSDAWTFFGQFALYFAFNSLNLYGNYSITLYNSYGSTTEIFQLLPPGPPDTPSNFSVQYLTSSLISLQWRCMWCNGYEQTVKVRLVDVTTNTELGTQYSLLYWRCYILRNSTLFQRNIQPETSYEASIWSTNPYGSSDVVKLIITTPKPLKFIVSPSNILIEEREATINFLILDSTLTLIRLNVTCCVEATAGCSKKSYILSNTDTQIQYDNLPTGTEYVFDFIVFDTDGYTYEYNLAVVKGVRVLTAPSAEGGSTDTNENPTTPISYDITTDVCAFNRFNPFFVLMIFLAVRLGVTLLA